MAGWSGGAETAVGLGLAAVAAELGAAAALEKGAGGSGAVGGALAELAGFLSGLSEQERMEDGAGDGSHSPEVSARANR